MNDTQTPVKRYNIGYSSDEWGMRSSTAGGLPDSNGKWVRYSDIEPLLKPLTPPDGWAEAVGLAKIMAQLSKPLSERRAEILAQAILDMDANIKDLK